MCLEIIKLIKYVPKQDASLEGLKLGETVESVSHEDLESNDHNYVNGESLTPLKLKKICVTRSTLRHVGFQRMCMNYEALLKLWENVLSTQKGLQSDVTARIIGVNTKMKSFHFL